MAGEPKEFAGHALRHRFGTNSSPMSRRGRNLLYVCSWPKMDIAMMPGLVAASRSAHYPQRTCTCPVPGFLLQAEHRRLSG